MSRRGGARLSGGVVRPGVHEIPVVVPCAVTESRNVDGVTLNLTSLVTATINRCVVDKSTSLFFLLDSVTQKWTFRTTNI